MDSGTQKVSFLISNDEINTIGTCISNGLSLCNHLMAAETHARDVLAKGNYKMEALLIEYSPDDNRPVNIRFLWAKN